MVFDPTAAGGIIKAGANRPVGKKTTTGDYTLKIQDFGKSLVSLDSTPVNYFLPTGLPDGFIARHFQGGSGQVTYVTINGATLANGQRRSQGQYSDGYFVDLLHLGGNEWVVLGETVVGINAWSLVGPTSIREGDSATFVIWRPDSTSAFPEGVTLEITETGFSSAGFSQTLAEYLTDLAKLEPGITFDGVNQLTIEPGVRNPIPLSFFPEPTYSAVGDRNVSITIANPSDGTVSPTASVVTTAIRNVSKRVTPAELFPAVTATMASQSLSGTNTLELTNASSLLKYSTVTHSSIPALTYITGISGNTVTLSANLTGNIAAAATVSVKPPGAHFDFSSTTGMTLDGSNKCSSVLDKIHGYPLTQATGAAQPTYLAANLNGQGGLSFANGPWMRSTNPALAAIFDEYRAQHTVILVGKLLGAAATGMWMTSAFQLSSNTGSGLFGLQGTACVLKELPPADNVGVPYILQYTNDGASSMVRCNGQRIMIPATLTADAASGQRIIEVDDISSIKGGMMVLSDSTGGLRSTVPTRNGALSGYEFLVSSFPTSTQVQVNQNLSETMKSGDVVQFYSHIPTHSPANPARTTASLTIGANASASSKINAVIYEMILAPRFLSPQEWRGIHAYLSNKYSTSVGVTTGAAASAGAKKIRLSSTANVRIYQTVSGTNIKVGSTVVKVNSSTNDVWIDEPIQAGGVASGATLTFADCSFKKPDMLDINEFVPTFRDDFVNGVQFANSGNGWKPYYGSIESPGTYASAYGELGHGSSNNNTAELEWYLDVLNHSPWRQYTPFAQFKNSDVPKGGVVITASPTPAAIKDLVGYAPPQPASYPYISGYIRDAGGFSQQYGYWEARLKGCNVFGYWTGWWLTAARGAWPPEIDIIEMYGVQSATIAQTIHRNKGFDITYTTRPVANLGDQLVDFNREYALYGAEVRPGGVDFYVNREKVATYEMSWDMHIPWLMQLNVAAKNNEGADLVTPMPMWIDYAAAWRRRDQTISPTGSTQSETTALVAAMSVAPSGARQTLINTAIEKLKLYQTSFGVSLWSALDFLVVPAAHDAQAGRIDWKNPARVGTVVGSPTFTVDRGYAGVLNSAYIDMGFVLSTEAGYQLNSALNQAHIGAVAANITRTDAVAVGTGKFSITPKSGNSMSAFLWSGNSQSATTETTGGHYVSTRNHFQYAHYQNGVLAKGLLTTGDNTRSTDATNVRIANGTSRVAVAHGGDYLTPDDIRYLYAVLAEYLTAIGAL